MFYEDDKTYYEPDDEPSEPVSARAWATMITLVVGFWLFAIIGFCDVVHNLVDAVRRFFA